MVGETNCRGVRLSTFYGWVAPRQGGGHQTISLRLQDKNGKEWVIRSVEKNPESILPASLRKTFIKDVIIDAMSSQHPYSALIVAPIANAVGVPHADPVIGIIAPDTALGPFSEVFVGRICLLEEREPGGESDNYFKMLDELNADNDNSFDSTVFLRARILDVFLGDWDRHGDQWRFKSEIWEWNRIRVFPEIVTRFLYRSGCVSLSRITPICSAFFEGFNPGSESGHFIFTSTMMNVRFYQLGYRMDAGNK
jgi:hypothetical protein